MRLMLAVLVSLAAARVSAQLSAGQQRLAIANLTNRLNVVNFAGLFSGTAIAPPRSANVRLRLDF